jgi:hypothetical protein
LFGQNRDRCHRIFVITRQKHHAAAAIHARISGQNGSGQMVLALYEPRAVKRLGDNCGRRLTIRCFAVASDQAQSAAEGGQKSRRRTRDEPFR